MSGPDVGNVTKRSKNTTEFVEGFLFALGVSEWANVNTTMTGLEYHGHEATVAITQDTGL